MISALMVLPPRCLDDGGPRRSEVQPAGLPLAHWQAACSVGRAPSL